MVQAGRNSLVVIAMVVMAGVASHAADIKKALADTEPQSLVASCAQWVAAGVQRGDRHFWVVGCHLGLCATPIRRGAVRSRCVHHGRVLV